MELIQVNLNLRQRMLISMSDLINDVYLPDFDKRKIRDSDAYKLLKDNNKDTSVLEGYENTEKIEPIEFPVFNTESDRTKFVEENAASVASGAKDYLETFGNFLTDETEDLLTSVQLLAVNGADVAVNLMPLAYKMFEKAPVTMGMPKSFFNQETEEDVMRVAKHFSDNLGEYRQHLFEKQKDNGWVKDLLSFVIQDSAYSIPAYNMLRKAGVPKYPSFFLASAFGAVGVENVDKDGDKTYFAPFQKDVQELKRLIGILPDTPADKIADEVHQALEYGTFGVAIPGIIDAFKFMKQTLPKFRTVAVPGTVVGAMTADNEAEGSPVKAILKAVDNAPMFKSAVVDAADKIPTVANGDQIFNTIKNTSGVKQSELKWMDLEGFLKNKSKVSKDEVLEYINANKIDVTEVKLSAEAPATLPQVLRNNVDDYETRWRDSDVRDTTAPNYDNYKFSYKNFEASGNVPSGVLTNDWSRLSRSPFIELFDENSDMIGTGTPWKTIKNLLIPFEDIQGKYSATVIEIPISSGFIGNNLRFVAKVPKNDAERFVVSTPTLEGLPEGKFKKIASYEIDALELERFHLEDEIRNYRLSDQGNSTLFKKYTVPGGDNYTELVFKIKNNKGNTPAILEGEFGTLAGNKVKSEVKTGINYSNEAHFNQENEFAHVRFKTRELPNGKKALVVEEMQSDLLQASKTDLFDTSSAVMRNSTEGKVLKDFPFKNTWYEFTIKRLTRYAADNGFEAIAIPKGSLAANRYGQNVDKVKSIVVKPFDSNPSVKAGDRSVEPGFTIELLDENAEQIRFKNIVGFPGDDGFFEQFTKDKMLSNNKTLAQLQELVLLTDDTGVMQKKTFDKIEVVGSGTGKFRLYDQTIPSYMKKYAKKFNAKVYDDKITVREFAFDDEINVSVELDSLPGNIPVTILELSDEMKTGVQSSSQPLFELFGTVGLSTWGAKEVSDNIENNIISQSTN
jgi:hypothetical protein